MQNQYKFIYECLLEAAVCGVTEISSQEFRQRYNNFCNVDPKTKKDGFYREFAVFIQQNDFCVIFSLVRNLGICAWFQTLLKTTCFMVERVFLLHHQEPSPSYLFTFLTSIQFPLISSITLLYILPKGMECSLLLG